MSRRRHRTGADPHRDDVAVVGVAGVFPGAPDAATFWSNVKNGVDAISDAPAQRWDPVFHDVDGKSADRFYTRRGGFVDEVATFDPLAFGIMPNAAEYAEPDQLLALSAAAAALSDAGDVHARLDPSRVAVLLGRGGYLGDGVARLDQRVRTAQQVVEVLRAVVPGVTEGQLRQVREQFHDALGPERPEASIGLVPNLAASRIANRFDFHGPAYTVDAACASSLIAVSQACDLLRSDRADLVLAGGVHHCHDLTLWSVFTQLRALSPSGGIRPFSADADGILIGEGTGILALRRWEDAVRDGDRVYAVIRGSGVASDGRASTPMSPVQSGQVAAVTAAWRQAGLDPAAAGLVEAHGTATPLGDRTEIATLREVFGDSGAPIGLGSVKSMIGHAMPAAGAAGLVKTALALHEKVLPPTLHADTPHPDLAGSRLELVGALRPWDIPTQGPRLAGVNAFGFGGINAHVVLSEAPTSAASAAFPGANSRAVDPDETVLMLAGVDADDLIAQLDALVAASPDGVATSSSVPTGGPARLAVVAPDAKRMTLARKVLARGTAFRGRNDVWFDPTGLLHPDAGDGKVAFLFPGVEPEFDPRVDDVAERFGLVWEGFSSTDAGLQTQGRGIVNVGRLLAAALDRLGVQADLMAGHSLGEWTGQIVSGIVPHASVDDLLASLRPDALEVPDVVFVALGGGAGVAQEIADTLPDTYVSHDNCTRQSVICCRPEQAPAVLENAKARKVMAQELPFRSGFHSPLFEPFAQGVLREFGSVPLNPAQVPMWSATTLAPYPDDRDEILALGGRHLVEQVRFRELTEKLHAGGVRAFVQVGSGSLTGFLDDTLRDVDVLTVSALSAPGARVSTTGLGQLRRVAAALWSAGLDLDLSLLGHPGAEVAATGAGPRPVPVGRATRLRMGAPLVRDLTPLDLGAVVPATPAIPATPAAAAAGRHQIPVPGPSIPMTSADVNGSGPVVSEFAALVQEATAAAQQVIAAAAAAPVRPRPTPVAAPPARRLTPVASERETLVPLSVEAQPWWGDHAFYPQQPGWPVLEDRFPLVPLTGLVEMMGDAARELVPGSVVVSISDVRAFRWLAVEPAVEARLVAKIDDDASAAARAVHGPDTFVVRTSFEGHCRAVVTLSGAHPAAPAPAAPPVTGVIDRAWTPETIYPDGHLFHGPAYQGIVSMEAFGVNGAAGHLLTKPYPGSLLDNAGQIFGLWVAARADKDRLVLPTSVDEFAFFGEHPTTGTRVNCVVTITEVAETFVRADLELTVEGRVWCRISGWEDRRFQSDDRLFMVLREPGERLLALPRPGGWFLTVEGWPDSASREVVMRRFLRQDERGDHMSRNPRSQRARLLGRISAKDAVRDLAFDAGVARVFPAEVAIDNDDAGRPVVRTELPGTDRVEVSISHTLGGRPPAGKVAGNAAAVGVGVAIASRDGLPGIDVERVAERSTTFENAALTAAEKSLVGTYVRSLDADTGRLCRDRELTRWWAAKEAAAKANGTGLQGRPHDFEVHEVRPAPSAEDPLRVDLLVGDRWIATTSLVLDGVRVVEPTPEAITVTPDVTPHEEYIVAWTDR
ncbi:type I polyketide synthase [Nocardioides yefusunii]|uniref:Type I polyketide synthase n=1 Tax=Nocardioides yefusunii TaxID=2500546 RepID=A0ABW1R293_9ACTN|nr:type I polyketide synthase [Nocardioides yefusunii]